MKILIQYFLFFFLFTISIGQVTDPETGELVNLKYDENSGSYYLFGVDKMELLNNNVFQGKFISASDSLVFFKTELDGGKILEQDIASIKNLILESGSRVIDNKILKKKYITIEKTNLIIVKQSKIKKILSFINVFKFVQFIY
tara:strand:- start:3109 stop:3537 length:429 start_codon:yes stop_codon:yes gene_type:complete